MRIAFYGSSLLSSYWNGAATYYRGLLRAVAALGYRITFFEPDAYDRQSHRDIEPPDWAEIVVWSPDEAGLRAVTARAAEADVVVKASGVGVHDDALLQRAMAASRPGALRVFMDVDAPATIAALRAGEAPVLRAMLPALDMVLTYGGGPPVIAAYRELGAAACIPVYNALDPANHYPAPYQAAYAARLSLLANRLPDRESRIEEFFLRPAAMLPGARFLLGGAGWDGKAMPANVRAIGHVPTAAHNAFNASPRAVLNVARDSMAAMGFSPATRVFEAAGAGACLITDAWEGLSSFLAPGEEVLVARDGRDVARLVAELSATKARAIGLAARDRVLREHTYDRRARQVDAILREAAGRRAEASAVRPARGQEHARAGA